MGAFCLAQALDHDPPIYASHIAGIAGVNLHTWLVCWDKVVLTFLLQSSQFPPPKFSTLVFKHKQRK
jgi:hypothetical protein